ncbi:hypothetical protein [Arvimicrobium flavum]|uniref:hypothetical protein n=1 Tax=Arvimicrobium flavum TaxID=3393320 RepID=UPI00237C15B2|nr:hypothetical protein [Mesorhizobium shangrilense]
MKSPADIFLRKVHSKNTDAATGVTREIWTQAGQYHREDGPAYIEHDRNGVVLYESWYRHGDRHREGAPAFLLRDATTGVVTTEGWYANGVLHRTDGGPAAIVRDPNGTTTYQAWAEAGQFHRKDAPAKILTRSDGELLSEQWFTRGHLDKVTNSPSKPPAINGPAP